MIIYYLIYYYKLDILNDNQGKKKKSVHKHVSLLIEIIFKLLL